MSDIEKQKKNRTNEKRNQPPSGYKGGGDRESNTKKPGVHSDSAPIGGG